MTIVLASESEIRLISERHFLGCSTRTNTGCDVSRATRSLNFKPVRITVRDSNVLV